MINLKEDLKEVLIPAKTIEKQCQIIAKLIDQKYQQEPLVFVCLLKGAYIFATDLIKQVKNPNTEVEFIVVSSYHNGKSLGEIDVILDLKKSIKDKNVIIVEDILDTGRTLSKISEIFKTRGAKNIDIAVLCTKVSQQKTYVHVDYPSFEIADEIVVGYGLDYNEQYRHLPYIAAMSDEGLAKHKK